MSHPSAVTGPKAVHPSPSKASFPRGGVIVQRHERVRKLPRQRFVQVALRRQAAVAVTRTGEGGFDRFVTDGMTTEQWDTIGPFPRTHGLLGAMLESSGRQCATTVKKFTKSSHFYLTPHRFLTNGMISSKPLQPFPAAKEVVNCIFMVTLNGYRRRRIA